MNKITIGIDVGGTNTKCGLIDFKGRILVRSRFETKKYLSQRKKLVDAIVEASLRLMDQYQGPLKDIQGVGIGLPGLIDTQQGLVKFLPNIPGWKNVPLKKILEQRLGLRTAVENDVNLITLGEWKFGAGRGFKNIICVTLGTGVGGGLILDDRLYRGEGFAAGEVGHMPLFRKGARCNCGGTGCLERSVGNKYLLQRAVKLFRDNMITLEDVFARASRGDPRALRFWEEVSELIGDGLIGVVNLLNPRLIIIGGGVAKSHRFMFQTITKVIKSRAMMVQGAMFKIRKARLGDDAGLAGARVLVDELNQNRLNEMS